MTLEEFCAMPFEERMRQFGKLSIADQLAYVREAHAMELILGGFPSEETILAAYGAPTDTGNGTDRPVILH